MLSPCGLTPIPQSLGCLGASATFCKSRPGGLGGLFAGPPSDAAVRRDGGGRPWCSDQALLFSPFGLRAQKPRNPGSYRREERPVWGLQPNPTHSGFPAPSESPRGLFSSFSFPGCVLLLIGEVPEASQHPSTARRTQRLRLGARLRGRRVWRAGGRPQGALLQARGRVNEQTGRL